MNKLYQQYLDERKVTSQTKITRQAKIARDVGSRAFKEAQANNDALYKRMKYHLEMYKKFKRQIIKKYSSRVRMKART